MVHGSIMTMKISCGSTHFYASFSNTSMYRDFRVSHPFKIEKTDRSRNIHFTSISPKAERIYKLVLEGADFGVLWSKEMEETTGVPGENHRPWTVDRHRAACRRRGLNSGRSGRQARLLPLRYPGPSKDGQAKTNMPRPSFSFSKARGLMSPKKKIQISLCTFAV